MHRSWRLLVPLLAALAAGCGGLSDKKPAAPHNDAGRADSVPSRLDAQSVLPDTSPASPDTAPMPDAGGLNTEDTEAGGGASAEVGPEAPTEPASADSGVGPEAPAAPPATIIVLPDTQYYASSYPDVFTSQTRWIAGQTTALNIGAVLHVGDIVDVSNSPDQWNVASSAMHALDGVVPYIVVPGNHDADAARQGLIDSSFSPATMPWTTGTMTAGQIENSYTLVDVGAKQWLVIGLEFGPRDAVVAWADRVLKAYPDKPAILLTHAYLYRDGTRYDLALAGTDESQSSFQYFYPRFYNFTPAEGINDGEMLWQKLVLPNPNVRLVFSGHDTGFARLTSTRPDGSRVHQILSDYQWYRIDKSDYYGGAGYLRVLQLDYGKKTLAVQTYSPYLNVYLTDDANQFTLDLIP
jgi:3',5'-cyclic AMP phosphodiesterase CpdA